MTANGLDLPGQFAREKSQDAFTALVNLAYPAALRPCYRPSFRCGDRLNGYFQFRRNDLHQ